METSLDRFLSAQENAYMIALYELSKGEKQNHWIWYIFPQIKGLGHSYNSNFYGIDGLEEARLYLNHPVLGERLRECCMTLLSVEGKDIETIMSYIDALKLRSSMTLFDLVSPNDIFSEVLNKYYGSERDSATLSLLGIL